MGKFRNDASTIIEFVMRGLESLIVCAIATLVLGLAPSPVQADILVTKDVAGTAQPWDPALNSTFSYGANDGTGPTIFNAGDGFNFNAGDTLTITYVSGLTSAFGGAVPNVDGIGYAYLAPLFMNDDPGSSGNHFPSFYMGPYPPDIFLNALVGTFADSSGVIVGTPFAVDNGPLGVLIPSGATQLQLGVNDDLYFDNSGSLRVSVNGPGTAVVPEPASMILFGFGLAGVVVARFRRRKGQGQSTVV